MNSTYKISLKAATLISALVFALPSQARFQPQQGDAEQGAQHGNNQGLHLGKVFHRLDTDGDSFVSLEEMTAGALHKAQKRFDRLDADHDGFVSLEEFVAAGEEKADKFGEHSDEIKACVEEALGVTLPEHATAEERFAAIDSNQDGMIDIDEANAHAASNVAARFNALDADANGLLSKDELKVGLELRKTRRAALRECVQSVQEQNDTLEDLGGDELKQVGL
ncbi:MAG: EF-hand domain-containing protein [Hahellaceae bacterium]|nr:EF-hand domain-containing protein [Hahellaceae bacterium]MCP5212509.1 EF-hand domain-containing protein [Hahellaceae bacterium]